MGTSTAQAPKSQQKDPVAADGEIRSLLGEEGNTRAAVHRARHCVEAIIAAIRREEPARAALLEASLAGSLAAVAATLENQQPRRPHGYTGGPPSADHLLAAYTSARNDALRPQR